LLLVVLAAIGGGIWYTQQDTSKQRQAQERAIAALDWLAERDETDRAADDFLNWVVRQIPASRGVIVSVGNIEGSDRYTFAGVPVGDRPLKILENEGYLVGYDEVRQNPAWVAYKLEYRRGGQTAERPTGFETDTRTRARVEHSDYTNSGFDRGHMAPNYAIGMSYGEAAQTETFLMSNIVPQTPDLNRGPWKTVEQLIANDYLREGQELWVITGPIYGESVIELDSGVMVPTAFFKIVVDDVGGAGRC
jgi:endonuclease G